MTHGGTINSSILAQVADSSGRGGGAKQRNEYETMMRNTEKLIGLVIDEVNRLWLWVTSMGCQATGRGEGNQVLHKIFWDGVNIKR